MKIKEGQELIVEKFTKGDKSSVLYTGILHRLRKPYSKNATEDSRMIKFDIKLDGVDQILHSQITTKELSELENGGFISRNKDYSPKDSPDYIISVKGEKKLKKQVKSIENTLKEGAENVFKEVDNLMEELYDTDTKEQIKRIESSLKKNYIHSLEMINELKRILSTKQI